MGADAVNYKLSATLPNVTGNILPEGMLLTPVANVTSGVVAAGTTFTLSCPTMGASICYTTDVTIPITLGSNVAIYLADCIVVMTAGPGNLKDLIDVNMPRPRDRAKPGYGILSARILDMLEEEVDMNQDMLLDVCKYFLGLYLYYYH